MSYKKKREKKNIISQLKRQIGLIKIVLFKKTNYFTKKEVNMQQRQTRTIMQWLRERSKIIRQNNLKINEWVEKYIDDIDNKEERAEILATIKGVQQHGTDAVGVEFRQVEGKLWERQFNSEVQHLGYPAKSRYSKWIWERYISN